MLSEEERAKRMEILRSGGGTREQQPGLILNTQADEQTLRKIDGITAAILKLAEASENAETPEAPDYADHLTQIVGFLKTFKIPGPMDLRGELKSIAAALEKAATRETKTVATPDYSKLIGQLIASVDANTTALKEQTAASVRPKVLILDKDGNPTGIKVS